MTNKKKFISVFFVLFFVFGCQKQIQLSNGRVIYQPFDGSNKVIQSQPSADNSAGINPSVPNAGNQIGNGLAQLATPAVAGAALGSELVGNNGSNEKVDMSNSNNGVNTTDNAVNSNVANNTNNMDYVNNSNVGKEKDLENAINSSLGETKESAMKTNSGKIADEFGGAKSVNQPSSATQNVAPVKQNAVPKQSVPSTNVSKPATTPTNQNVGNVAQTASKTQAPSGYTIQVGNYKNPKIADKIANDLKSKGYDASVITKNGEHKIVVGDFVNKTDTENTKKILQKLGYVGTFTTMIDK